MLKSPRWRALSIAGREAIAYARQAVLLHHDVRDPVVPTSVDGGDNIVVMLHGLFATAGVLRPMRAALGRHRGVHTAAMTYPPGPGVAELASRLQAFVRDLPRTAHLHLVGHSMGGVVARYFVQEIGDPRIVQTISMASPFAGVPRAGVLGVGIARDIDPESPILRRIRLGTSRTPHVPHLSIIAASDVVASSPVTHALPGGDVVVMEGRGHNMLLFDDEVAKLVERRVLSRRGARTEPSPA